MSEDNWKRGPFEWWEDEAVSSSVWSEEEDKVESKEFTEMDESEPSHDLSKCSDRGDEAKVWW